MKATITGFALTALIIGCGGPRVNVPCDPGPALDASKAAKRQAREGDARAAGRLFLESAQIQGTTGCYAGPPCQGYADAVAHGFLASDQKVITSATNEWLMCIEDNGPDYAPSTDYDRIMLNIGTHITAKRSPYALPADSPLRDVFSNR